MTTLFDEMARKLLVHSTLDQIFSAQYDISRLPLLISQIGVQFIGCEFVSMWRYEPSEHILYNVLARSNLSGGGGRPQYDFPVGSMRLRIERGARRGIMMNLAAEILDGTHIEDMPAEAYIVNDRSSDERATELPIYEDLADASVIRSAMYAPLIYNGFKGMMVALNHKRHAFTTEHWEILKILALKAAIIVDNIEQHKAAEQTARLALLGSAVDMVRHEMKSPLTAISGAAQVILKTLPRLQGAQADRNVIQDMATTITTEVERNVQLLRDIQNYCKPRFDITLVPTCLNDFLRESREQIVSAAGEKRPDVTLELADDLPPIPISPEHMLEVLRNLVRNASEAGSSSVEIRTAFPDSHCRIEVCDRGGGMDEPALASLFRPYESRRARGGGSGLGLFICRRIVEEGHGGRMSARNVYDGDGRVGLCIQLDLPIAGRLEPH